MKNNQKLLIGLCGGSLFSNGTGKTTAANHLVKKHNFYLCDLIKPVEEAAKKLSNWDGVKDAIGLSIINHTCIYGRKINENYWLNIAISSIPKNITKIVFDNVYFKNEADFINNNGFVIKIERNGFAAQDLDFNCYHNIENNGSINEFENKIDELMNKCCIM